MSVSTRILQLALSALFSAGHEPTRAQRLHMQTSAWRFHPPADAPLDASWCVPEACALLRSLGYAPDASKPLDAMLPDTVTLLRHSPAAGHVVRVVGDGGWMGVRSGDLLTLSSCDDRGRLRIGRGRVHVHDGGLVGLPEGGPSSIGGLRTEVLGRTDETVPVRLWRWALGPEAGGGVDYVRPAPVWTWDGDEAAFRAEESLTCR